MKILRLSIVVFISLITTLACSEKPIIQDDQFYNSVGTWDSARIPLIKPYYLAYIDKETGWQMSLVSKTPSEDMYYYYNIHGIEKISVNDGLIMIYTPYIEKNINLDAGDKIYHWFVISPEKEYLEIGFENEVEFLVYIERLSVTSIRWEKPDDLYKTFYDIRCLEWIPGC